MRNDNRIAFAVDTDIGLNTVVSPAIIGSKFHHVVGTYTNGQLKLYLDGVLVASSALNGTVRNSPDSLKIGSYANSSVLLFSGIIDDVRVCNIELSEYDVLQLYNAEVNLSG